MSRNLNATLSADLQQGTIRPILLYEGVFPSGTIRLWNGTGPLVWNTYTWSGTSTLHGIRLAAETTAVEATGIEVFLSGATNEIISLALTSSGTGQSGKIWLGTLNDAGAINGDPYLIFSGKFDYAEILESSDAPLITLRYESQIIELERGKEWRYTPESQKVWDNTDKGFDYVSTIQEWKGFWGKQAQPKKKTTKGATKPTNRRTR